MCRYAMNSYKPHYACFECRKSFKRRLLIDVQGGISQQDESSPSKCPECGKVMANMGLDFKAPKKTNIKAWNHLSTLYEVGITFHSCGCVGPGYIPNGRDELIEHLTEIRDTYIQHQHFWARRKEEPSTQSEIAKDMNENGSFLFSTPLEARAGTKKNQAYDAEKAHRYWGSKIQELEKKLKVVST